MVASTRTLLSVHVYLYIREQDREVTLTILFTTIQNVFNHITVICTQLEEINSGLKPTMVETQYN